MPSSSKAPRISSREWANRKPRILELYINDGRTLAEVIEEMTKEGFTATKSQYEHKFRVWRERKNMKRVEWAKAIREREQGGSTAPFILSGRELPGSKVETARRRYAPKRPQVSEEEVQGHAALPIAIEDDHMFMEELTSEATMVTAGFDNEAVDMSIYAGINEANLDQDIQLLESTGETIDMLSHETPVEFSFHMDSIDLINSINFDLPAQETGSLPTLETCLPFRNDLWGRPPTLDFSHGVETQQAQVFSLEESYFSTAETTLNSSLPVVVSPNSLHGHRQTLLKNQWISPSSATIVAKFIKDVYGNISPTTSTRRAMLNPNSSLVWQFLACMDQKHSGSASRTGAFRLALNNLFSAQFFTGEVPDLFAILPNDVAPEARLYARLIASVINGFADLRGIRRADVLKFLNRHTAIQLLMVEFMCSNSGPVARSLAENIFQAALEADDVDVIRSLLDHNGLIDANETVCHYRGGRWTPLEKAAICKSIRVIKLLISRKVDINKSFRTNDGSNALEALITNFEDKRSTLGDGFLDIVDVFLEANATISARLIERVAEYYTDPRLAIRLAKQFISQAPYEISFTHPLFQAIVKNLEERAVISIFGFILEKCQELGGDLSLHKCVNIDDALEKAVERGHKEVVRTLLPYTASPEKALAKATKEKDQAIIDLIIQTYPLLDECASNAGAFIAALKSQDEDRLHFLEERNLLNRLRDNPVLGDVFVVALEAGNLDFSTKILNVDPDFEFLDKDPESTLEAAFNAALANNFDDIAWDILAVAITRRYMSYISLLRAVVENRKPDFMKVILESAIYPNRHSHPPHPISIAHTGHSIDCLDDIRYKTNGYSSIVETAIEWGDDCILNDILQAHPSNFSPSSKLLKLALEKGRPGLIIDIIEAGPLEDRFWKHFAAGYAIQWENIPMLDKLINVGTELDDCLLDIAVTRRSSMVKPLLERYWNIYPQGRTRYGWLATNHAVEKYSESPGLLDMLFASKLVTLDILQGDGVCITPLVVATKKCIHRNQVHNPFPTLIKRLLDAGSNVNSIAEHLDVKTTAFLEAIGTQDTELVKLFIQYGAEIDKPARSGILWTPLQKAAGLNNLEIVCLLLDKGADPNAPPAMFFGATALQFAAMQGNCEIARVLVEHGAKLDTLPARGRLGRWPLEGAAENGRLDMISYLWELNGGPFDDKQCQKAIRLAERNGHLGCRDMIKLLMANGSSNGGLSLTC
ncbi:uncharacterized protein F4807DRAFT_452528 [Annulohypoxylon truncatum]|uniref:uncharacterized protein n=1 Tax=Annulohypoxylon truncatum TaxID=327061 RepID=UPI00200856D4|nr:uncharacterized protein F4807DRAFT_452528 [Annulohypoxylon truncatum]KAI1207971.1 hypothetical protein F4807DRAFT_452528 [Annulohypoxylon truncatum]